MGFLVEEVKIGHARKCGGRIVAAARSCIKLKANGTLEKNED